MWFCNIGVNLRKDRKKPLFPMTKSTANINEKPHIPHMGGHQRVLIAPLNWGLGHASRCVPLILELLRQGHKVLAAADGEAYNLLNDELRTSLDQRRLQLMRLRDVTVRYADGDSQVRSMLRLLPALVINAVREHRALRQIIHDHHIDLVISDNRFGLWTRQAHCVYMTHQLNIKAPKGFQWVEPALRHLHACVINRYDQCWIPDYADPRHNLSGDLAHRYPTPAHARFIGPLSRFTDIDEDDKDDNSEVMRYETVAIVSGPEPHRTRFERLLRERLSKSPAPALLVCGKTSSRSVEHVGNLTVVSSMTTKKMRSALQHAQRIICRSGYTSLMDLNALHCLSKACLCATPGQTEQEYLLNKTVAEHLLDIFE